MNVINRDSTLYFFLLPIKKYYEQAKFKSMWRIKNSHNKTNAVNIFPLEKVSVGRETYGDLRVFAFGGTVEELIIGNYCSIAGNVTFILGGEHPLDKISSFPFSRYVFNKTYSLDSLDTSTKGKIIIGDDVWIGDGATILSGVTVGQGAVIGAGSVVTKNIPPYAVFANNDIKKYRFNYSIIQKLLKINYGQLDADKLNEFSKICDEQITEENIDYLLKKMT